MPSRFEVGLQDYAGILACAETVDYLTELCMDRIQAHIEHLNSFLIEEIINLRPKGIELVSDHNVKERSGICSFTYSTKIHTIEPSEVSNKFSEAGIAIRIGDLCNHEYYTQWFKRFEDFSVVIRASLYFYNTMEECEYFIKILKDIFKI